MAIRIAIVGDHPPLVEGLCSVLERRPEYSVHGIPGWDTEALQTAGDMRCDVLIIDVGFRGERSPLVMNAIQQVRDKSRVIVHAVYPDPEHVWRMFQEGVWGVLEKSGDFGELENAVGTVASGSLYVDRAILARAGRDFLSMIQRENFGPAGSQSSRSDPA